MFLLRSCLLWLFLLCYVSETISFVAPMLKVPRFGPGLYQSKVLIVDPVSEPIALERLEHRGHEVVFKQGINDGGLQKLAPDFDALIVRSANRVNSELLRVGSEQRLAVIGRAGSGVDNIDVEAATQLGLVVVNAPGGNAVSVAELVFGLLLAVARCIPHAHAAIQNGQWAKNKVAASSMSLAGKTMCVVGLGNIGQEVAKRAAAFGMKVVSVSLRERESASPDMGTAKGKLIKQLGIECGSLQEMLPRCDVLTVHVPLTAASRGLIGADELAMLPRGSIVLNTARGGIVDEHALLASLRSGHLGGAGLDVFNKEGAPLEDHIVELASLPNAVLTPHIGASTREAGELVLSEVCDAVADALDGSISPDRVVSGNAEANIQRVREKVLLERKKKSGG